MMHLSHNGVKWIPDDDYTLGLLLLKSGDQIGVMYDLITEGEGREGCKGHDPGGGAGNEL